jgi:hypothetical protein
MAKKEKMLRGKSFPMNNGDQYYELLPAGQTHEHITEQLVIQALFSQSVKTPQAQTYCPSEPYASSGDGVRRES